MIYGKLKNPNIYLFTNEASYFKKEIMRLPQQTRDAIAAEIETKFDFLFKQLNVGNKRNLVNKYIVQK